MIISMIKCVFKCVFFESRIIPQARISIFIEINLINLFVK